MIPENYLIYKVKSGDSLWKIANEYNTTAETLKQINNYKCYKVQDQFFHISSLKKITSRLRCDYNRNLKLPILYYTWSIYSRSFKNKSIYFLSK